MPIHATNALTRRATFWPLTAHLPRHLADNNFFALFFFFVVPECETLPANYTLFPHMVMERFMVQDQHPGGMSALKYRRLGNPNEILDSPLPQCPSQP